jgi:hypothetical protein
VLDQRYQEQLRERLLAGTLAPAVEALLWHFAFGKPLDRLAVETQAAEDLQRLTLEDLELIEGVLLRAEARREGGRDGADDDHPGGCDHPH